ncbi:hypothetical protein EG68_00397 [Paragonimus skrjabini miyazakii]|uniref:NADH dehydrogenase [ubiquinone] 1 alpha subcomplex subunit 7 n=1 Tax=Paragonimus skrjabini miyazakii TaxID=59628 RepID=A0A8S9ZAD8_9TREM|nr:hypothetical protein EG68_00397 [Paragonimus skrjabini miyazakii]
MSVRGGDRLTPFVAKIRDFLLQRKYNNALRYTDKYSKRTQPPPFLPDGINHQLSENPYYLRDMRRLEVRRPQVVYAAGPKLLTESGGSVQPKAPAKSIDIVPGLKHNWDRHISL